MNIEDYEAEEVKQIQGEVEEKDKEAEEVNDLWEAMEFLGECRDLFEELTKDDQKIDMPLELELNIYKLDKKIKIFLEQWED